MTPKEFFTERVPVDRWFLWMLVFNLVLSSLVGIARFLA